MMRTREFLGLSMAERSHRRILVMVTYLVLAILMGSIIAASANTAVVTLACVILAWNIVSGSILGRLVTNTSVPQNVRFGELIDLGLVRNPRDADAMDERDVAVRNAACFKAYRVIGIYTLVLVLLAPGLGTMATVRMFEALLAPLLAMILTLPQAIILWTEPDVPVEAHA
ncbi:MAG TPA: hypothetical protein VLY23_16445 [Candidatus Acidoferrum sp.]|nr:hypothetical protein [Candidatus Acidoferrum sp.]